MPDPADKARPSSAPLSAEDADRIADGFTAIWEDPPAPAAVAAEPAPTPHPGAVTAPMPAVAPAPMPAVAPAATPVVAAAPAVAAAPTPKPGKQTLVGIAPINIERPSEKPPEKPPEKPAPSDPHPSAPIRSSPEVPGYAIAYTPKDPPSTPAVVIAPEAQSSPSNEPPEDRRRFSQTVPSIRSAPNASLAPLPALPALPAPTAVDDFDPDAPKKGKGKIVGLVLGGALLLLVSVLGVRALGGGSRDSAGASAPSPVTDVVHATTVAAATPTSAPSEPAPAAATTPSRTAAEAQGAAPAQATPRAASERAPAKAKIKAKAEPAAARPLPRAPTPEPSPPAPKPASKGVIVRDAPF
jgi:hypothetical protein